MIILKQTKGFTILEMIIAIIIIGILATLAINNYSATREKILDNQAIANLKLIRTAEKSYYLDIGTYYPVSYGDIVSDIALINQNLKVFLPAGSNRSWNYEVWGKSGYDQCYQATRNGGNGRIWILYYGIEEPYLRSYSGCSSIE